MKNKIKYLVVKDKKNVKSIFFQCDKIDGFNLIKEKKKIIKGVSISKILIVNKKFVEKAIDKKLDKRLKSLLELLANICESDDSGGSMHLALDEIEKFKRIIQNEYFAHMQKRQIEMINKKIKLIENEIKMNLYQSKKYNIIQEMVHEANEEEFEKSGHRRR